MKGEKLINCFFESELLALSLLSAITAISLITAAVEYLFFLFTSGGNAIHLFSFEW